MHVTVNGENLELEADLPLLSLLQRMGRKPGQVAIERNGEILESVEIATAVLHESDHLEILHFVGGG